MAGGALVMAQRATHVRFRTIFTVGATLLVALGTAMSASSQEPASAEAERLVRAIRMDRLIPFGLRLYLAPGLARNQGSTSEQYRGFLQCIDTADTAAYVQPLADVLTKEMSRHEIREAVEFFDGDSGKKLVEAADLLTLTKLFSGHSVPLVDLSETEAGDLDRFRKTPAGKTLLVSGVLNLEPVAELLAKGVEKLARACAQRP